MNKAPKIGQVLHNGATVIQACDRVILARWINDITPFVTWEYRDGDTSTTTHGHYFTNFESAVNDYQTR